jgi:hypothetical protein
MVKRGAKRELNRELQYWELLRLGLGTVEACRRVGSPARPATAGGLRWAV